MKFTKKELKNIKKLVDGVKTKDAITVENNEYELIKDITYIQKILPVLNNYLQKWRQTKQSKDLEKIIYHLVDILRHCEYALDEAEELNKQL